MRIPVNLPPELDASLPYDLWKVYLVHGIAKHMLEWRQEGMVDADVIFLAMTMIEKSCVTASGNYQQWLEIEYGKDTMNMYNTILREAAAWITINLSTLSPAKPRDYHLGRLVQCDTAPIGRVHDAST